MLVSSPSSIKERWLPILDLKSSLYLVFLFLFYWNTWFSHLFRFLFCDFIVLVRRWLVRRLCAALFVIMVSFRYLFGSDCHISFDLVHIQSMTLASSMLQFRRHEYSRDLKIVICVTLFAHSSFLFLANLHCIDVLYQFEWMNIIYFWLNYTFGPLSFLKVWF